MFGHQDSQDNQSNDNHQSVVSSDDTAANSSSWQHPDALAPANDTAPPVSQAPDNDDTSDSDNDSEDTLAPIHEGSTDDLINIKQQALTQLSPLIKHLDQTPEEKFRTTMMMIQASDDQSLIKTAYEAAVDIKDEKSRAQALLDIINEINYFTHPTKT